MHLENFLAPLEVGQLHRHPPVKPSRPGESGVEGLGAVGGGEDDDAAVALKAVHLREQLVEGLLPLVVAAQLTVALLTDGVDLVDKHDARCLLLGLLEEIAHLGRTHAHEHLHKFRAGDGKEGHVGLACHCLGQHGLAGSGRPHQQHALGHGGADLPVFSRVVEIFHDLGQVFLGLILAGHVAEMDALGGIDIDLGIGLAHAEHHAVAPSLAHELLAHKLSQADEDHHGQDPREQYGCERRHFLHDLLGECRAGFVQPVDQTGVKHHTGLIDGGLILVGEQNLIVLHLHQTDLLGLRHIHKCAVIHLLNLPLGKPGHDQGVEQHQRQDDDEIVKDQRFLGLLHFFHKVTPSLGYGIAFAHRRALPVRRF